MTNTVKKCSHCGSSSILPISYGLMTEDAIEENARERKWVWGGCVIREGGHTHHCSDCNKHFGGFNVPKEDSTFDEESFLKDRGVLFGIIDEFLDGERDEELYAQALKEAKGDEIEADHIYFDLFMQSKADDETK